MNQLNTKNSGLRIQALLLAIILGLVFTGCAATKKARGVKYKGYLVDASILHKGKKGEALYVYINEKTDWPSYSKILLDPVITFRKAELKSKGLPPEDLQRMANNFYLLLYKVLDKDYEMVKMPGPRTLRIQVALTDLEKSWATADTVTSLIPVGMGISIAKDFITGKPAFVGEASVEAKITDARTNELLVAGIDRRVGTDKIELSVDSWDDVNAIFEIWSKWLRFRLCKMRDAKGCWEPNGL